MKFFVGAVAAAAIAALSAGEAMAADPVSVVPMPVAAPMAEAGFDWNRAYLGVSTVIAPWYRLTEPEGFEFVPNLAVFYGRNWVRDRVVIGGEVKLGFGILNFSNPFVFTAGPSVQVRVGVPVGDKLLPYAVIGTGVYGVFVTGLGLDGFDAFWSAGLGLEYAASERLGVFGELKAVNDFDPPFGDFVYIMRVGVRMYR